MTDEAIVIYHRFCWALPVLILIVLVVLGIAFGAFDEPKGP